MVAVQQANTVLSWHEVLLREDVPPRWMWHLPDELEDWFEEVRARHDRGSPVDDREEVPMWENELAAGRG